MVGDERLGMELWELDYLLAMHNRSELLWAMEHGEADYAAYFGRLCAHYARIAQHSFLTGGHANVCGGVRVRA